MDERPKAVRDFVVWNKSHELGSGCREERLGNPAEYAAGVIHEPGTDGIEFGQWQPIETAPRDGTWVLISESTGTWLEVARWYSGCWCSYPQTIFGHGDDPPATHWMPLPDPPG